MRLFIAINFDRKTKENITAVQNRLKAKANGRFSHEDNLHLTLVFLGEVPNDKLNIIKKAMDSVTMPKMELVFNHIGHFKRHDGDIWWIGLKNNQKLINLQAELSDSLITAGFNLEKRSYRPHITLARHIKAYSRIDKCMALGPAFSTSANSVSLMLSQRIEGKLTYTELYNVTPPT